MSYLTPFAEQPKVFAPVLSHKVHGAFRRTQATVRWGSVDALTVVLKLDISRTFKAWLVLLYYNHGVLDYMHDALDGQEKSIAVFKHMYKNKWAV